MNYLFETEHFLFRKRVPEDNSCLPKDFDEGSSIPLNLETDPKHRENTHNVLIIEFRTTCAPAGKVVITNPVGSMSRAEAFCCLYREFQRGGFEAEIAEALDNLFGVKSNTQGQTAT